jgi:hypothetical protein
MIDAIEYNLEQFSDLSIWAPKLPRETTDSLIERMKRFKAAQAGKMMTR